MLLLFFCLFLVSEPVVAAKVKENSVTNDPDVIYKRYKNNSFELMTKEQSGLNPFKKSSGKITGVLKNIAWGGTRNLGKANATMVKMMFDLDVVQPIKKPLLKITSRLARSMLSIAGTIGIGFVSMVMAIKFIGEQRFRRAIGVFVMTIFVFVGLVTLKNSESSNSFFDTIFTLDKEVETAIVNINPVLNDSDAKSADTVNGNLKSAGSMIASKVFYTNVYEPYLLLNYGTTNTSKIRESKVKYKLKEYDRINLLLDNDAGTDLGDKIQEKVIDYESDDLENNTISYTKNGDNAIFAFFYLFVNLIQSIAYFIICFVRIVISVMQLFLIPLLPILLLVALFISTINPFKNFGKAFGMTVVLKAMAAFSCILFASFLSIGFKLAGERNNVWEKLITIIIYLLAPFGIYFFRTFLGSLFTGEVTLQNAIGFATHPFSTQKMMRDNAKARKKENRQRAKEEKAKKKQELENARKKAFEKGKTDIGMNQSKKGKKDGQSNLRRNLQPNPKHQAPTKREALQSKLEDAHNQSRKNEAKEISEMNQRRARRTQERDAQKTAAAVAIANKNLSEKQGQKIPEREKASMKPARSSVKDSPNRTGRSSKRGISKNEANKGAVRQRRQGQRDLERSKPQTVNAAIGNGKLQEGRSMRRQSTNNSGMPSRRGSQKASQAPINRANNPSVNHATMTTKAPRGLSGTRGGSKANVSTGVNSRPGMTPNMPVSKAPRNMVNVRGTSQNKVTQGMAKSTTAMPAQAKMNPTGLSVRAPRNVTSSSGIVKRRAPKVQKKMSAMKEVTSKIANEQPKFSKKSTSSEAYTAPQKNITRVLKKQQKAKQIVSKKGQTIRKKR